MPVLLILSLTFVVKILFCQCTIELDQEKVRKKCFFYLAGSYANAVGECTNTKITRIHTTTISDKTTTQETEIYEYVCFERDVNWGYLSLTFMCVPGLFFWIFMSYKYSISILKRHICTVCAPL